MRWLAFAAVGRGTRLLAAGANFPGDLPAYSSRLARLFDAREKQMPQDAPVHASPKISIGELAAQGVTQHLDDGTESEG